MADYGKIINKSIETTKKFKWLWVYGLVLGAASSGSGSSGGNWGGSDNSTTTTPSNNENLQDVLKNLPTNAPDPKEVLGTFTNQLTDWLKNVSPENWLLLFLGIVLLVIIGIGISWVLSSWANGGLIGGLKLAHQDKETTLKNTTSIGMANIKPLIKLGIVQFFVILIAIALGMLVIFIASISSVALGDAFKLINVLLVLVGVFGGLYLLINFALTSVFAQRFVVLSKLEAWEAWKSGWKLSTKNFFPGIVMAIVNAIISGAFGCITVLISLIVLGIPAAILAIPMFTKQEFSPATIITLLILIIIFFAFNLLIRAITVVFNASNWNLFFEEITHTFSKEMEKKENE